MRNNFIISTLASLSIFTFACKPASTETAADAAVTVADAGVVAPVEAAKPSDVPVTPAVDACPPAECVCPACPSADVPAATETLVAPPVVVPAPTVAPAPVK